MACSFKATGSAFASSASPFVLREIGATILMGYNRGTPSLVKISCATVTGIGDDIDFVNAGNIRALASLVLVFVFVSPTSPQANVGSDSVVE
jgi:hypothetical protein